jgi:peptidoglycan hydrolase CwlO-like protein
MSKIDKKKKRLQEKIKMLQDELNSSLQSKSNGMKEIDIVSYTRKIETMQKEIKKIEIQ